MSPRRLTVCVLFLASIGQSLASKQQSPGFIDASGELAVLPGSEGAGDAQGFQWPESLSQMSADPVDVHSRHDADVRVPSTQGFLHSVPRNDARPIKSVSTVDQENDLEAEASTLQQQLSAIQQELHPAVSDTPQGSIHSDQGVFFNVNPHKPVNHTEDLESLPNTSTVVSEGAAGLEDRIYESTIYSKIGMFGALALQFITICLIGTCMFKHDIQLDHFEWYELVIGLLFLMCSDLVFVLMCTTGILDLYIQQGVIISFIVLLVVGHVFVIIFICHRYAVNKFKDSSHALAKHAPVEAAAKIAGAVIKMEEKLEKVISHLKVDLGNLLHKDTLYDSESEGAMHPFKDGPKESAKKYPIWITLVKATNLQNQDLGVKLDTTATMSFDVQNMFFEDKSDAYASCAVRGRKDACWEACPVIKDTLNPEWNHRFGIEDFRNGDALKFKVFDFDKLVEHDSIAPGSKFGRSTLLGKHTMNHDAVWECIYSGEVKALDLRTGNEKEGTTSRGKASQLFVKIAQGHRASVHAAQKKERQTMKEEREEEEAEAEAPKSGCFPTSFKC